MNQLDESPSLTTHQSIGEFLSMTAAVDQIVHLSNGTVTREEANDHLVELMRKGATFTQAVAAASQEVRIAALIDFYSQDLRTPGFFMQANCKDWLRIQMRWDMRIYVWTLQRPFNLERFG